MSVVLARRAATTGAVRRRRATGLAVTALALVAAVLASLAWGASPLPPTQVLEVLVHPDDSEAAAVVWGLRVPRTAAGLAVGAAFGVAGALIQALTRNPLADPGILGVNAGAGFAVTIGVSAVGIQSISGYLWFAFAGAAAATVLVALIGASGGGTVDPVRLVLAGVALAAVLGGVSTFLALSDADTYQQVRSWAVGSIAATGARDLVTVLPFLAAGLALALALGGSLDSLALGDDLAASLGADVARTRLLGVVAVTLLAGGATALTGGIGFVGLMVPHIVRWFTGPSQRWILAGSALAAPVVVLVSDVVGRLIARPGEIEVGLVTAVVGAPVLIALVRRRRVSGL